MVYYEIEEDSVIRYDVTVDWNTLESIKETVQESCSEIIQIHEDIGTEKPKLLSVLRTRYSHIEQEVLYDDNQNFKGYKWTYTEYKVPKLVSILERLFAEKPSAIWDLRHPTETKTKKESYEDRINQYLPVNENTSFRNLKSAISDYEAYLSLNKSRLLKNQTDALSYYPQVLACIELKEVCRIPIDDFLTSEAGKNENNQQIARTEKNEQKQKRI